MLAGMRSVLGLVGLVGGAATVVLAIVSFFAEGSFQDFLYRLGIVCLLLSAAALAVVIAVEASRPDRATEPAEQSWQDITENVAGAVLGVPFAAAILLGAFDVLAWTTGRDVISWRGSIEFLGALSILYLVFGAWEGRDEVVAFAHKSSRTFRQCPRCGNPVEAGVMECPHCHYNFWNIGREAD